jgi:hypothetical protein
MWRLDRVVQDRSVSNFDVVRRFVVHPKEEFYMRFKKRAVLLTALAVTAVSAATVTQPASARPQYPIGSATIQSIDGYTLFTKLTASNATCDDETTNDWSVDWSFAGTAQSPEFETKIVNVSPAIGGDLVTSAELKQPAAYPQPSAYRDNRFTTTVGYTGITEKTLTVTFKNTVFSANGPTIGEDTVAKLTVKSPCASEAELGMVQAGASVFTPVPPARILDTRNAGGGGKFADQETRPVPIYGAGGVPAGASAVVLNVTATEATKAGFVTVWPGGGTVPSISSVNVVEGQTVPNLVTVQVGSNGKISVFSAGGTHVLIDVMGYYEPTATSEYGGRYQAVDLQRAADTRNTGNAPGAGGILNVPIAGRYGVPDGATAAVLNLTVSGVVKGGFTTVYPGKTARPTTSNLNSAGEDRANQAIVQLGPDGSVDVFSENGSQVIVDVAGYFTDDSAPLSRSGLFIPITPIRVLNTRDSLNYDLAITGKPGPNSTTYARVGESGGIDTGFAGSVVTNVTAVDATAAGFVTVYLNGSPKPDTSSLNPAKGETVPNHATTALGTSGDIAIHTTAGAHFIVDAFGWYTA